MDIILSFLPGFQASTIAVQPDDGEIYGCLSPRRDGKEGSGCIERWYGGAHGEEVLMEGRTPAAGLVERVIVFRWGNVRKETFFPFLFRKPFSSLS
jgi:hypothetical protein